MSGLAEQQAALVRALVAGGPAPTGFDADRLDAGLRALLRKRTDEVARHWPALLAAPAARARFARWADGRPKTTSFDDGLEFARTEDTAGRLSPTGVAELHRQRPRRWRRVRR